MPWHLHFKSIVEWIAYRVVNTRTIYALRECVSSELIKQRPLLTLLPALLFQLSMRFNRRLRRAPPAALRMGGISVVVVVLSCAASRRLSVSPAAPSVTAAAAATGAGGGISCSARSFARRAPRPRAPCVALRTRLPVSPRPDPRPEARTGAGCCLDAPLSRAAVELGHVDCAAAGCGGAAEGSGGAAIRSRYCLANASPYATSCEQPPHSKVTLGSAHKPIISYTHQHPRTIRKNVYCGS